MKTIISKAISVVLALLMCVSCVPFAVFAESADILDANVSDNSSAETKNREATKQEEADPEAAQYKEIAKTYGYSLSDDELAALKAGDEKIEDILSLTNEQITDVLKTCGYYVSDERVNSVLNSEASLVEVIKEAKENATIIVELDAPAALADADDSVLKSGFTPKVEKVAQTLIENQEPIKEKISDKVFDGETLDVIYSYGLVTNGFAFVGDAEKLDEIEKISGVKDAYVSPVVSAVPTDEETAAIDDNADFSIYQSNTSSVYSGKGQVIAVIDTGLDTTHSAFDTTPDGAKFTNTYLDNNIDYSKLNAYTRNSKVSRDTTKLSDKVPFVFNYADDNFDVTHKNDDQGDHGTHVAGICVGYDVDDKTGEIKFMGTAPNAQLAVMKVFGNSRAGQWSDILAAMEDCVTLGVDVINMSLGSYSGFTSDSDSKTNECMTNLANAGIIVSCAAGNEYTSAYGNMFGNDLSLASNPDNSAINRPASYTDSLAVASAVGEKYKNKTLKINNRNVGYTNNCTDSSRSIDKFNGKTVELALLKDESGNVLTGTSDDFEAYAKSSGIKGKFAVIKRGENFTDTVMRAEEKGAVGLMVFDHSAGALVNMAENTSVSIPAIFVSKADGDFITSYCKSNSAPTMFVSDSEELIQNSAFGAISDFSSQGVTNDLKLKPEIAGLGGNIYSTRNNNSYGTMSGTSMASPYVAGISACMQEYLDDVADSKTKKDLITQIMMSTAKPLENDGTLYSPRRQGAGLVNTKSATETNAYLTANDGTSAAKLDLGDSVNDSSFTVSNGKVQSLSMSFNVNKISDDAADSSYTLDVKTLTEAIVSQTVDYKTLYWDKDAQEYRVDAVTRDFMSGESYDLSKTVTVSVTGDDVTTVDGVTTVTLDKKSTTVNVTLSFSDQTRAYLDKYENGIYVDGYVFLNNNDENGVSLSIPFLSFYGDWAMVPIFDGDVYQDAIKVNEGGEASYPQMGYTALSYGDYGILGRYNFPLGTTTEFDEPSKMYDYWESVGVKIFGEETRGKYFKATRDNNIYGAEKNSYYDLGVNDLFTTRAIKEFSGYVYKFPNWTGTLDELYEQYKGLKTQSEREQFLTSQNAQLCFESTISNMRKSYYYNDSMGILPAGYFQNESALWNGTDKNGNMLEDGTVCMYITYSMPDYHTKNTDAVKYQNTLFEPFRMDSSSPDVSNVDIYAQNGKIYFEFDVVEPHSRAAEMNYKLYVKKNSLCESIYNDLVVPNMYDENGKQHVKAEITNNVLSPRIEDYTGLVYVSLYDYRNFGNMYDPNKYLNSFVYTGYTLNNTSTVLAQSKTLQLDVTGTYTDPEYSQFENNSGFVDTVCYESMDKSLATVDSNGLVTAVNTGFDKNKTVKIKVYSKADPRNLMYIDLTVTPYNIQKDIDNADPATTVFYDRGDIGESVVISQDCILDLGGATITSIADNPVFVITSGAKVRIQNGTLVAQTGKLSGNDLIKNISGNGVPGIKVEDGDLTIENMLIHGGKYTLSGDVSTYTGSAIDLEGTSNLTVKSSELHGYYAINNTGTGLSTIEDGTFFGTAGAVRNYDFGTTVVYPDGSTPYDTANYYTGELTQDKAQTVTGMSKKSGIVQAQAEAYFDFSDPEEVAKWKVVNGTITQNLGYITITPTTTGCYLTRKLDKDEQFAMNYDYKIVYNHRVPDSDEMCALLTPSFAEDGQTFAKPSSSSSSYMWIRSKYYGAKTTDFVECYNNSVSIPYENTKVTGFRYSLTKNINSLTWDSGKTYDVKSIAIFPNKPAYTSNSTKQYEINATTNIITVVKDASSQDLTTKTQDSVTTVYAESDESNLGDSLFSEKAKEYCKRFGYRWVPSAIELKKDGKSVAIQTTQKDENGRFYADFNAADCDGAEMNVTYTLQAALAKEEADKLSNYESQSKKISAALDTFVTETLPKELGINDVKANLNRIIEILPYIEDGLIARDLLKWDTPMGEAVYKYNCAQGIAGFDVDSLVGNPYYDASNSSSKFANANNAAGPYWGIKYSGTYYARANSNGLTTLNNVSLYTASVEPKAKEAITKFKNAVTAVDSTLSEFNEFKNISAQSSKSPQQILSEQLEWLSSDYYGLYETVQGLVAKIKCQGDLSSYVYSATDYALLDYILSYSGFRPNDYKTQNSLTYQDVVDTYGTSRNPDSYNPFDDPNYDLESIFDPDEYANRIGSILEWSSKANTAVTYARESCKGSALKYTLKQLGLQTTDGASTYAKAMTEGINDTATYKSVIKDNIITEGDNYYLGQFTTLESSNYEKEMYHADYYVNGVKINELTGLNGGDLVEDIQPENPLYRYEWYSDQGKTNPVDLSTYVMDYKNAVFYGDRISVIDEAIDNANSGDTINIDDVLKNTTGTPLLEYPIDADNTVTLVFGDRKIDFADNLKEIINVNGNATVTIKNSVLGLTVSVDENSALVVDNSTIYSESGFGIDNAENSRVTLEYGAYVYGIYDALAQKNGVTVKDGAKSVELEKYTDKLTQKGRELTADEKALTEGLSDKAIAVYTPATVKTIENGDFSKNVTFEKAENGFTVLATAAYDETDSSRFVPVTINTEKDKDIPFVFDSEKDKYVANVTVMNSAKVTFKYEPTLDKDFSNVIVNSPIEISKYVRGQISSVDDVMGGFISKTNTMLEVFDSYKGTYVEAFVKSDITSIKENMTKIHKFTDAYTADGITTAQKIKLYYDNYEWLTEELKQLETNVSSITATVTLVADAFSLSVNIAPIEETESVVISTNRTIANNEPIFESVTDSFAQNLVTVSTNDKITVDSNTTYVKDYVINSRTLTFVVDGETYQTDVYSAGDSIVYPNMDKRGYTFSGWSETPETMPDSDLTLTGTYTINKYLLSYYVDGKPVGRTARVNYGAKVENRTSSDELYTFTWYQDEGFVLPVDFDTFTMPAQNTTLYGKATLNATESKTITLDTLKYSQFDILLSGDCVVDLGGNNVNGFGNAAVTAIGDGVIKNGSVNGDVIATQGANIVINNVNVNGDITYNNLQGVAKENVKLINSSVNGEIKANGSISVEKSTVISNGDYAIDNTESSKTVVTTGSFLFGRKGAVAKADNVIYSTAAVGENGIAANAPANQNGEAVTYLLSGITKSLVENGTKLSGEQAKALAESINKADDKGYVITVVDEYKPDTDKVSATLDGTTLTVSAEDVTVVNTKWIAYSVTVDGKEYKLTDSKAVIENVSSDVSEISVNYAFKSTLDKDSATYLLNSTQAGIAKKQISILDSAFEKGDNTQSLYATLSSDTVSSVIENKSELVAVGVSEKDVDNASKASQDLQNLLSDYKKLANTSDKLVNYYKNYSKYLLNFTTLYDSILRISSNSVVASEIENQGKKERFAEFLAQLDEIIGQLKLYEASTQLNDEQLKLWADEISVEIESGTLYEADKDVDVYTVSNVPCKAAVTRLTFDLSVMGQLKLIEPWGLKVSVLADGLNDLSGISDYGVYYVKGSQSTVEDVINNANAVSYTKLNGGAKIENVSGVDVVSASYDKDLYTYEFDNIISVVGYIKVGDKTSYTDVKSINILSLVTSLKDNEMFSEKERTVYEKMYDMYYTVKAYRDIRPEIQTNNQSVKPIDEMAAYNTQNTMKFDLYGQIRVIEPWGLQISSQILENNQVIDYTKLDECGFVVCYDPDNGTKIKTPQQILENDKSVVYNAPTKNIADSTLMTCLVDGIYTYQLNNTVYVLAYAVKDGKYYYDDSVSAINIYDYMTLLKDYEGLPEDEKAVYNVMLDMYAAITDYRSQF